MPLDRIEGPADRRGFVMKERSAWPSILALALLVSRAGSARCAEPTASVPAMAASPASTPAAAAPRTVAIAARGGGHPQPDSLPSAVREFRLLAEACDGAVIASPEYVHAPSGVTKNALDWLAGSTGLYGKPVLLLSASPGQTGGLRGLAVHGAVHEGVVLCGLGVEAEGRGRHHEHFVGGLPRTPGGRRPAHRLRPLIRTSEDANFKIEVRTGGRLGSQAAIGMKTESNFDSEIRMKGSIGF